jgi:hypothetical protein
VLLERCNVEKVLKIRTGSAKCYRLVINPTYPVILESAANGNRGEPRRLGLENVKIVMEKL